MDSLVHLIPSFTEATAQKLGLNARSVSRYTSIMPDVREIIANTWLASRGAQLDALARETPDVQRQIADFVTKWDAVRNISEILRQIRNQPRKKTTRLHGNPAAGFAQGWIRDAPCIEQLINVFGR